MKKNIISLIFLLAFSSLIGVNWEVQLIIENSEAIDSSNYFGKHDQSLTGHDNADILEFFIPPNPPYVSLYFPHPEWGNWAANYTRDIRSDSLQNEIWNIEIIANPYYNQEFQLSWLDTGLIPNCYDIELNINSTTLNMRETDSLSFSSSSSLINAYIELIVNNYPPEILIQIPPVYIMENQSDTINNLDQYFYDADGDSLTFSVISSPYIEITFPLPSCALIVPEISWYGNETIRLQAKDTAGATVDMDVEVIIEPSQPNPVENIQISVDNQLVYIEWQPVTTDINNMPVNNIVYHIYESSDPDFVISSETLVATTESTFISFPYTGIDSKFYNITANNGIALNLRKNQEKLQIQNK